MIDCIYPLKIAILSKIGGRRVKAIDIFINANGFPDYMYQVCIVLQWICN